jgi:hypothetical protein
MNFTLTCAELVHEIINKKQFVAIVGNRFRLRWNHLMKLRQIAENYVGAKLRELLGTSAFFQRPSLHQTPLYDAARGHDAGATTTGSRLQPIGVPHKPQHRKFLGFQKRPGSIRL